MERGLSLGVFTGLGLRPASNCLAVSSTLKVMENNARHVFLFKMWAQIQGEKMWGGRGGRQVCLGLCPPVEHAFQDFRPNKERHLCPRQRAEQTHPASIPVPWAGLQTTLQPLLYQLPSGHGSEHLPGIVPGPCSQLVHRCRPRLALSCLKSVFI